jgi:IS30 family transposase
MFVSPDSPVGVRFFAAIKDGQGINKSARLAGIHTSTGYRFLQTAYLRHRRAGLPAEAVLKMLGFQSTHVLEWESQLTKPDRHHLRVDAVDEDRFWSLFGFGMRPREAAELAGVSRPTADRWLQKRFISLREAGTTIRHATAVLRLTPARATRFEDRRIRSKHAAASTQAAAVRNALSTAGRHADTVLRNSRPPGQQRAEARRHAYWELMRSGMSNTDACTLLGMSRVHGSRLRKEAGYKIPPPPSATMKAPRYLELRERLQIADLLHLGHSLRTIAAQLGRSPSTVSRELRRHRDSTGRYLPRTAHHDALQQRSRPKIHRLVSHHRLRQVVQRKLNRYWSPDEISGWLKKAFPDDTGMRLCPETIYRALLLREDHGLKKNLAAKLRTGRRIRKTRWVSRYKQGSRIRNMTMIDRRPVEHSSALVAGNWEGDLIVGVGSVSAMVTLRERKTQYGIIVNLPDDHTAASVNAAVTAAFSTLPRHLKKSLTWDQGVEMSSHEALTEATGVPIYFAERSSPWQRGANENFNGLARQFFPKGTDLSKHSADHVAKIMKELNDRPRKGLAYDTPAARLRAERNTPTQQLS